MTTQQNKKTLRINFMEKKGIGGDTRNFVAFKGKVLFLVTEKRMIELEKDSRLLRILCK